LPTSNDEHATSRGSGAGPKRAALSPAVTGDGVVDLDVSWLVPADLDAVDVLARLQVTALRRGHRLLVHGAHGGLVELLEVAGLGGVVHLCPCCGTSARCDD
jgi:hypothetical protein